jgi:glycosyltransferase involved in cell wall biosynthesis
LSKIRLTYFIPQLELGGSERQLLLLAGRLNQDIFEISIITSVRKLKVPPQISVQVIPKKLGWDPVFLLRLRSAIRQLQPHILHTISTQASIWGLMATLAQRPAVLVASLRGREMGLTTWHYRLANFLYPRLDRLIVNSSSLAKLAMERFSLRQPRLVTIPNGVDTREFHPPRSKQVPEVGTIPPRTNSNPIIGWVGNIRREKGFDKLVQIAGSVTPSLPRAKFLVVGKGPDFFLAHRWVKKAKLTDKFIFTGQVENVAPYYRAMALLVNTSLSEGMCSAILEAMASGLPVVSSDIPANRLLVNDGEDGYLVSADNVQLFAARIIELLQRPAQARKMGRAGRKKMEEGYSLPAMVTRYEHLYKELLRERGGNQQWSATCQ